MRPLSGGESRLLLARVGLHERPDPDAAGLAILHRSFLRHVPFVPDNKPVDDLLQEFQEKKVHMAIVLDEFGGTAGMVTLEDILEEVVGPARDESAGERVWLDGQTCPPQQVEKTLWVADAGYGMQHIALK